MKMKKIFLALIVITAFMFGACTREVVPVTVSLSQNAVSEMFLSSVNSKTVVVSIENTTNDDAEINWEREAIDNPAGFTYMVNGAAAMSGVLTVVAGESIDVMLMVHPNGNTGLASGSIKFYDSRDMDQTIQTYTYSLRSITEWFTISANGLLTNSNKASSDADYYINVVNPNPEAVGITWRKVDAFDSNWQSTVCTNGNCCLPVDYSKDMAVGPNETVNFKMTIRPNGVVGNGTVDALFFVPADSTNTVASLQINHTATN
jgi:hypothetical protein